MIFDREKILAVVIWQIRKVVQEGGSLSRYFLLQHGSYWVFPLLQIWMAKYTP